MTLSSCVIRCNPRDLEDVKKRVEEANVCDIHIVDESGYIVVTIEGENTAQEIDKLKTLQFLDGVLSADLIYSYSEEELEALREDLEVQEPVPEILEKEVPAEQIVYHGDLKKKYI
ncbi:periplasmic nitrate reductase NapD [Nitratiruptor sp. YY08-26]|uniref:chaperone NapD n=1 Tax=unclassified Nitratiruptor TaxID=2624044 RepID=UPI001915F6AC|nr:MULTISPECIES: chaperone NapD [unclassified Nitratiruptor]BCD63090.1 periplasmic nitrate reductase NapD [Nitratiruptor sp. YY08-13]BCD67025.1 periplasmic nitrate reductase NapD [Nitratiruptor sp. YY08-26]